jgi:hypothetical protein
MLTQEQLSAFRSGELPASANQIDMMGQGSLYNQYAQSPYLQGIRRNTYNPEDARWSPFNSRDIGWEAPSGVTTGVTTGIGRIYAGYYGQQPEGEGVFDYNGTQMRAIRPGEAIVDYNNLIWDANRNQYLTTQSNIVPDPGLTAGDWLSAIGLVAAPIMAGYTLGGAGAAGTAAGAGETTAGMLAAQEAGFTGAELAGWGGATTAGTGAAAGGLTQQAMLAEQYAGLGYNAATANSLAAADIASGTYGLGSTMATSGGMLDTAGSAYNMYSNANKANNVYNMLTGSVQPTMTGGGGMATDWGGMLGGVAGGLYSNYLANQGVDQASQLASGVKFTPYAISSDIGRTYQDPTTGEMISRLDPRFAEQQQAMLGQVGSNLAAAQADPQLAALDAYNKMRQLSAFPEEQQRLAMENRLLQQGMLGSTGGANQTRAMQEAMNTNAVNQQLQAIGLGQTLTNNATQRAMQNWTGAMAPTAAMAGQMGQTGQFGQQAMTGQLKAADIMQRAQANQSDARAAAAGNVLGSGMFAPNTGTSGGLFGQAINYGVNNIGNWLGGNTSTGYGADQYANLIAQQDGFNWSGIGGVSAGSAQDMMLNDQWDWSW